MLHFEKKAEDFEAGCIAKYESTWLQLTTDPEILNMIRGTKIEFDCSLDYLPSLSRSQSALNDRDSAVIDAEVQKMLGKKVISACEHVSGEVISPIFTRPKKDGSFRMILNLKALNSQVTYRHFKMETLSTALSLIRKGCYMASLDLKDAYYSVPIHKDYKKLLRFEWKGHLFEFNALPNGLAAAPRLFTRLLKPVFATLREAGHISTVFLDDSLLIGYSEWECIMNVRESLCAISSAGFIVHPVKSVFTPTQQIQYLGVVIDSESMTVKLTQERMDSLKQSCHELLQVHCPSVREVAEVVGKIVASFPAVQYGPLHYRSLERDKIEALKCNKGDFDSQMTLSEGSKQELEWWCANVHSACKTIGIKDPEVVVFTDSSLSGWGCVCEGTSTGGHWLPLEKAFHINYLEIKAALMALKCFAPQLHGKHVRLMIDNTIAVHCINNLGTNHSASCNDITLALWNWCTSHNIWVSAAHIPGKNNVIADAESRRVNLDAEWKLNSKLLKSAFESLAVSPSIDLFATRLNTQMNRYVSYRPDPDAVAIDAFSISWKDLNFYAFPPFSVIPLVLNKVQQEKGTGIIVVPEWKTQSWFPVLLRLLQAPPVRLSCRQRLLQLPSYPDRIHPLIQKRNLHLLVCRISSVTS